MDVISYENDGNKTPKSLPPLGIRRTESNLQYKLTNNTIPHNLPPRSALRSSGELNLGVIDTWPAHSANQRPSNLQLALTKNNSLVVTNALAEGKPELTPKPKFLDNLEKFLQRELKLLGCYNSTKTSEARLQAYREAFEYLLEEFKTYKPILASIKNEYEMMLAAQREKIRELEPLKQMLVTLADQCDHKLMQYREQEKFEIRELKDEKKRLIETVMQLKNDKQSLQTQVDKLQSELVIEHEKFRNEHDKRKLLISDLNDLRFQQEEARLAELKREKMHGDGDEQSEETTHDDPVTLKIALRVCRQNLNDAMKRLTKMEADYGDVIPRRDYVALETVFFEIKEKNENLEMDHTSLQNDYSTLKDYTKNLETKMQELQQDFEIMRANNTPRPDWERCNSLIDNGASESEKWKDMTVNKSSIQILDHLINEINGTNKKDFVGLGTGHDIPVYLRHDGKIKNKNLSRREICTIITSILKDHIELRKDSGSSGDVPELGEFSIDYLKKKYPHEAYEYSYSIHDSFEKYSHELIKFYQGVLNGDIDEQLFYYEKKWISILMDQLKDIDAKDQSNGYVSKNALKDTLRHLFKYKTSEQISNLVKLSEEDSSSTDLNRIDYKSLLSEESEDTITNFLITFKSYVKDERLHLANLIKESIGNLGLVIPADLRKAINSSDDTISDKNVEKIVAWIFDGDKQIDLDSLKKRIENCCLYNYPKK